MKTLKEILFRGFHECENGNKTIKLNGKEIKGEWVYGCYSYKKLKDYKNDYYETYYISDKYSLKSWKVIHETVSQWTGLASINNRIFEGDIVKWGHLKNSIENPVRIAQVKICPDIEFVSQIGIFPYGNFMYQNTIKYLEIIGNIYENSELLEVNYEKS